METSKQEWLNMFDRETHVMFHLKIPPNFLLIPFNPGDPHPHPVSSQPSACSTRCASSPQRSSRPPQRCRWPSSSDRCRVPSWGPEGGWSHQALGGKTDGIRMVIYSMHLAIPKKVLWKILKQEINESHHRWHLPLWVPSISFHHFRSSHCFPVTASCPAVDSSAHRCCQCFRATWVGKKQVMSRGSTSIASNIHQDTASTNTVAIWCYMFYCVSYVWNLVTCRTPMDNTTHSFINIHQSFDILRHVKWIESLWFLRWFTQLLRSNGSNDANHCQSSTRVGHPSSC